jgi:hypothetical protein
MSSLLRSEHVMSEPAGDLVAAKFQEKYGASPRIFRAPGRVNLIGEHTDYNDGFVMPAAIGSYTWIAAARREDRILEVYSGHFDEKINLSLVALAGPPRRHWSDFIRGVAATLQDAGHLLSGANLFIHWEVPLGAGLSSSASLEVTTALALSSLSGIDVPFLEYLWAEQYIELGSLPNINYVQIFENRGEIMGCSNPHPHGQIWANQTIPNEPRKEQESQKAYLEKHNSCLLCDYLQLETQTGTRMVVENAHFAAPSAILGGVALRGAASCQAPHP